MSRFASPLVRVAALLLGGVNAMKQNQVISKLQIHLPPELLRPGGYDHKEALFGVPPYGGSIQQQLYYVNSTLCDENVDTRAGFPHRPIDSTGKQAPWQSPFLLMVDRGDCTFVTKVRNAQRSGAAGVIIADNTCDESVCQPQHPWVGIDKNSATHSVMAGDGSGGDITIPSFLMYKQDADSIKEALISGAFVQMEMAWTIPSAVSVEYSLWSVPYDPIAEALEQQFGDFAALLGDKAKFTPHLKIYSGMEAGCVEHGENQCRNLCTNKGRYCDSDPDRDITRGASGADVVTESLRRLCVWETYGEDGIGMPWWNYVKTFTSKCAQSDNLFSNETCIKDAMQEAGVSWEKVERCMVDSGGLTENMPNVMLDKEIDAKDKFGVVIWPAVFVNGAPIRGAFEFEVVLKAVCAGYSDPAETPKVCSQCANCGVRMGSEYECVKAGGVCSDDDASERFASGSSGGGSVDAVVVVFFVMILFLLFAGLVHFIRKRSQAHVREDVIELMGQYMRLEEDDRGAGTE